MIHNFLEPIFSTLFISFNFLERLPMHISNFFSGDHQPAQVFIFVVLFLLCWNFENFFGVSEHYRRWQHDRTNFIFLLPGAFSQLFFGWLFIKGLLFAQANHTGLLEYWDITSPLKQLVVSFVIWDFYYYVYHVAMHKWKFGWRFHAIHHSDEVMNVSTSLREHPGESFIRLGSYMLVSWAMAPAIWLVGLHQFIQVASKIVIHSNWRLPERLDKYLSLVFLTPNMHHVHHHNKQPYTDSNYGDLLSIWDRLFGTYQHLPAEAVHFGLDAMPATRYSLTSKNLFYLPFSKSFKPFVPAPSENESEIQPLLEHAAN